MRYEGNKRKYYSLEFQLLTVSKYLTHGISVHIPVSKSHTHLV